MPESPPVTVWPSAASRRASSGREEVAHEVVVRGESRLADQLDEQLEAGGDDLLARRPGGLEGALVGPHLGVERLDDIADPGGRLDPHRQVAAVLGRRNRRDHPVVVAVLGEVLDVRRDRTPRLEVVPEDLEDGARHVRMTHEVVGAPDELVAAVPGDADEDAVPAGDDALPVGRREEELLDLEGLLGRSG